MGERFLGLNRLGDFRRRRRRRRRRSARRTKTKKSAHVPVRRIGGREGWVEGEGLGVKGRE